MRDLLLVPTSITQGSTRFGWNPPAATYKSSFPTEIPRPPRPKSPNPRILQKYHNTVFIKISKQFNFEFMIQNVIDLLINTLNVLNWKLIY